MNLSQLQRMDPIAFEKFVGQLFRNMGYKVETTAASGDEGIDLVLRRGRRSAVVQCKRYGGTVGQPVVRDLYGTMIHTGASEAYLVTTGTISRAATTWAEGKPIHLVDGHRLVEWTRTRRLTYDRRPALARTNRTILIFAGLVLLAVLAIYLTLPATAARLERWQQAIYSLLPGGGDDPVTPAATGSPTERPPATARPTLILTDPATTPGRPLLTPAATRGPENR